MPGELFKEVQSDEIDPVQAAVLAELAKKLKVKNPKLLQDADGAIFAPELKIMVRKAADSGGGLLTRTPLFGRSRVITGE